MYVQFRNIAIDVITSGITQVCADFSFGKQIEAEHCWLHFLTGPIKLSLCRSESDLSVPKRLLKFRSSLLPSDFLHLPEDQLGSGAGPEQG